jgi:hypothetical protein
MELWLQNRLIFELFIDGSPNLEIPGLEHGKTGLPYGFGRISEKRRPPYCGDYSD